MAFLNPILLFGLAAVAAPVLIHLLNRRKYQHIPWGAMRFLRTSVTKNQRRLRIEDWLLLLFRCAILALLAIALARPAIRQASGALFGGSNVTAVILLDNSYSMSQTDGSSSRFDQAKIVASQVIDSLPSGSKVSIIVASDIADAIIPQPTADLNLARQTIAAARLTDRSTDLL